MAKPKKPRIPKQAEQEALKSFLSRRHPEYYENIDHWEFLEECYEGGREWFKNNIFRYIKEGNKEYSDRVGRAYRFNHTREVVDLVDKYIFKMEVSRNEQDAPDYLKEFWKNATLNNISISDFMKQVSKQTSISGRIWIVVDNNKNEGEIISKADEKENKVRSYVYAVSQKDALDMSYDDDGNLNWILIHEQIRDDEDPLKSSGQMLHRFRLWERNQWTLFTLKPNGKQQKKPISSVKLTDVISKLAASNLGDDINIEDPTSDNKLNVVVADDGDVENLSGSSLNEYDVEVEGPVAHSFGSVPVFHADNTINNEPYESTSMIDDVAYLDRAVSNYLSNLDAIIQDQTFSQLIMPAQGMMPGDSGYDKIIKMGTSRIFTYDGEGGGKPEYISPDVRQAEIILKVINKIINEIYHTVGLSGERTKEDNALGIDNSSGVAKAYDFERVNSLLASKADSLEHIENKINCFVRKWNGDDVEDKLVLYPQNFDVRGLYDEFEIATNLSVIGAPDSVRRLQMNSVVDKLFPTLAKDLKEQIKNDIKSWKPPVAMQPQQGNGLPQDSKQGQNTEDKKNPQ